MSCLPHLVLLLAPLAVHLLPQTRFQSFPTYQQVQPYQDFYQPVYHSQGQQAQYQGQKTGYQVGQGAYQTGPTGYQMGQSGYQAAPLYPTVGYNYPGVQTYPDYPSYPQATYYQNYYTGRQPQSAYQDPVFNYMLNDLSFFGPELSPSKSFSSSSSSSSPSISSKSFSSSSTSSSPSLSSSLSSPPAARPAWQGRVAGVPSTRCHDGTLLPFRARCDNNVECEKGEDEYGCDWHKNSTITTITGVRGLEQVLREQENVMVEFFAPWCPACVTFLPELEKLAETSRDLPLTVVKVNTDDDPELKELFKVDTYPRVLLWSKKGGEGPTFMYSGYKTYKKSSGLKFKNVKSWTRQQLL